MLAGGRGSVHTAVMSTKSAALLAFIGMLILTILLLWNLVNDVSNAASGVLPVDTALKALIYAFAGVTVTLFFFAFHRSQS